MKYQIKIGKGNPMKKRKPPLDTTVKHKTQVLKIIPVNRPYIIEKCVIERLKDYQFKSKKEYFTCSYNQAIIAVADCLKFFEKIDVDTTPDIIKINRSKIDTFDSNKIVKVIFTHEKGENDIANDNHDINKSDDSSVSNDDNSNDRKDAYDSNDGSTSGTDDDDFYIQTGGSDIDIEPRYLNLKLNYLQIVLDLM